MVIWPTDLTRAEIEMLDARYARYARREELVAGSWFDDRSNLPSKVT